MTELVADVLPWLLAFYVLDAVVQLRRGQVVFERDGLSGFRLLRHGLHASALWPWGVSFVAYELPYLASPEALFLFDPDAREGAALVTPGSVEAVRWEALGAVQAVGGKVKAKDRLLFRARSPAAARSLAAELEALRQAEASEREALIRTQGERALDLRAARAQWQRVMRPLRFTTTFATAEAVVLFAGLPYVAFLSTAALRFERALLLLALLHLGTLISAGWTLRRAEVRAAETVFMLAIFPAYAARAGAQVLRDAWWRWEPLAVAAAVLPPAAFGRLARQERVRAAESLKASGEAALQAFWRARLARLDAALAEERVDREVAVRRGVAFCELCLAEYRAGFNQCADCGLPLRAA